MQGFHIAAQNNPVPQRITVFLPDSYIDRLDAWRRLQKDPPSRPMALRLLATMAMDAAGVPPEVTFPDGGEEPDES